MPVVPILTRAPRKWPGSGVSGSGSSSKFVPLGKFSMAIVPSSDIGQHPSVVMHDVLAFHPVSQAIVPHIMIGFKDVNSGLDITKCKLRKLLTPAIFFQLI